MDQILQGVSTAGQGTSTTPITNQTQGTNPLSTPQNLGFQVPSGTNPHHDACITTLLSLFSTLENKVNKIEEVIRSEEEYFKSAKNINTILIYFFILSPLLFIVLSMAILAAYITDDKIIDVFKWAVSIIGVGLFIEMIFIPAKIITITTRLENLERLEHR